MIETRAGFLKLHSPYKDGKFTGEYSHVWMNRSAIHGLTASNGPMGSKTFIYTQEQGSWECVEPIDEIFEAIERIDTTLQSLGFEFEGDQEKVPQVTTIQAYNWLRKYYKGSQTTVDIIRTARGQLALVVATWEANGEVDSYLFCQIENETQQDLVADLTAGMFPRCDHSVILEQMAKEPTEVI